MLKLRIEVRIKIITKRLKIQSKFYFQKMRKMRKLQKMKKIRIQKNLPR